MKIFDGFLRTDVDPPVLFIRFDDMSSKEYPLDKELAEVLEQYISKVRDDTDHDAYWAGYDYRRDMEREE